VRRLEASGHPHKRRGRRGWAPAENVQSLWRSRLRRRLLGGAWLPPRTYSCWGAFACVFCCEGGTWLVPMKNSGCRTAPASDRCGNGGGGTGNKINNENMLGC